MPGDPQLYEVTLSLWHGMSRSSQTLKFSTGSHEVEEPRLLAEDKLVKLH